MIKDHKFLVFWLRKLCSVHFCFKGLYCSLMHSKKTLFIISTVKTWETLLWTLSGMRSPKMKIYGVDNVFLINGIESKILNLKIDCI